MANKVKKNYLYNLLYQILIVVLPIITTPYISRVLGSEGVGTFSFTYSIVSYFTLFGTLGVAMYGRREIAYLQSDKKSRSETFWQINIIKWIAMSISMLAFYFICARTGEYSTYYKIFALELVSNAIDISWYYQGLERFKTIAIRNMIIKISFVAMIFIFVKTPSDLWLYITLFAASNLLSNISLWVMLPKTIQKVKIKLEPTKKHVSPILFMFLPQIAVEVYTVLDKTMLGILIKDMNEVGIYEQSQKLEKMSLSIVTALGPVMASRVANLYSENKKDEIKDKLKKSFHFMWFLTTPIALGIASIAANLVPWFLGNEFIGAIPVMQIGVLLIFAIGLSNATGHQYLVPTKKQRVFTASIFAGAITNLIGNLILIPSLHAIGAIIASVIAESMVTAVQLHYTKKAIPLKDIFGPLKKCLPAGVAMFVVVWFLGRLLPPTIIGTVVQIAAGAVVYIISVTILRDEIAMEGWQTVNKIKKKILKK